jgi:hypothetical protein
MSFVGQTCLFSYLILLIRIIALGNATICDQIDEKNHICMIQNINRLEPIKLECNITKFNMLIIYPETRFVLNASFEIVLDSCHSIDLLRLSNFAGVNVNHNIFSENNPLILKAIQFYNSDFMFYSNVNHMLNDSNRKFFSKPLYKITYESDVRYFENISELHFKDADLLDIRRANANDHLSFGYGAHQCMGKNLARMELQIFIEELTRRLPHMRLQAQSFSYLSNMSLPTTTCWMFLLWMRRPAANETGYG